LKVVADDADADHRKNRGHGSRILSDRDGRMTRASKQAREQNKRVSKGTKNPSKKGEKNTQKNENEKDVTHDSGGHEYVDLTWLWRVPAGDFLKLLAEICLHIQRKKSRQSLSQHTSGQSKKEKNNEKKWINVTYIWMPLQSHSYGRHTWGCIALT